MSRDGLYIGSISPGVATTVRDAVTVFTSPLVKAAAGEPGGYQLPAVPMGETDDPNWVDAQLACLDQVSALRRVKRSTFGRSGNYRGIPIYLRRRGAQIDPDELNLRFADRVNAGYSTYVEVCKERGIDVPRLQLGINTLDLAFFGLRADARTQLGAFVERTRREVAEAWEVTGGNLLLLVETPCATILANMFRGSRWILDWLAASLEALVSSFPAEAPWAFHFCYGDLSNSSLGDHGRFAETLGFYRLLYKPEYSVKMANHVLRRLEGRGLVPEFVQYPLALGKRPPSVIPADYAAFRNAYLPNGTRAYGGAIHSARSTEELRGIYGVLDDIFGHQVGMSSSCGYGRQTGAQMNRCLDHMAKLAAA